MLRTTSALLMLMVCAAAHLEAGSFSDGSGWQQSAQEKYTGRFAVSSPTQLRMDEGSKHYGLSRRLDTAVVPSSGPLVVQYEVSERCHATSDCSCGGAYIKLLSHLDSWQPSQLNPDTPYSIMFGPDRCGMDSKIHLIIRQSNPVTGAMVEHHLVKPPKPPADPLSHVYTLLLTPPTQFSILVDGEVQASGSLLDKQLFTPPLQPSKRVRDPTAVKPAEWDDRKEVSDPLAVKPDNWVDQATIPDPKAQRPEEWDNESDGLWQAPSVPNPHYKGPWAAPQVPNPDYQGPWTAPKVANPAYFKNTAPLENLAPIGAVAFELWTVHAGTVFSKVVVAASDDAPAALRAAWRANHVQEKQAMEEEQQRKLRAMAVKTPKALGALAQGMLDFLDLPGLAPVRPYAEPLAQMLREVPATAYVVALSPLSLLALLLLAGWLGSGKGAQAQKDELAGAEAEAWLPVAPPAAATTVDAVVPQASSAAVTAAANAADGEGAAADAGPVEQDEADHDSEITARS